MKCLNCDNDARKESGLCWDCEDKEQQKINGILFLPALGIVLSVMSTPFSLYDIISSVIIHFKKTGFLGYYALGLILFLLVMFALEVFTALSFFLRKKRTRNVMIIYYLMSALLACYMVLLPAYLSNTKFSTSEIRMLVSALIGITVWIPYFLFSKRIPLVFNH
ncbi:DUF2569 domain-containing protein [Dickeya oryzae]|uniref:DUF2569 domain-containing protein n=1 Tax=Dickeya oryzae TaxID=1240404 RepID=UPI001AECAFEB|nr:DUF2569 domain-containing protein [Dickeya oryzae]MBP2851352.1 DUF2569 domain-containing protein [Dickeya oryzae]